MTRRTDLIGFSQRVRLEWLEQTANLILAGNDKAAVNDALQELLKDKVSVGGQAIGCNRNKIISILRKVWVTTPEELVPLRNEGLAFLSTQSSSLKRSHLLGDGHGRLPVLVGCSHPDRSSSEASRLRCRGSCPASDP
jgi:hypothetical protein